VARVEFSGVINRPVEDVFRFLADSRNNTRWSSALTSYEKLTDGPPGEGTTYRYTGKFLGRRMDATRTVTKFRRNAELVYRNTKPIPIDSGFVFEAVPGGTKLSIFADGELTGLYRWISPVFKRAARGVFASDFGRIKTILEAPSSV
jgi:uncharacterized protein YndB with AHSA1/START domain